MKMFHYTGQYIRKRNSILFCIYLNSYISIIERIYQEVISVLRQIYFTDSVSPDKNL